MNRKLHASFLTALNIKFSTMVNVNTVREVLVISQNYLLISQNAFHVAIQVVNIAFKTTKNAMII